MPRSKRYPSLCTAWQGDDVGGFENPGGALGGGIAATGNYPGKARNADELRRDLDQVYRLLPGNHRLNLHAIYLESDTPVARNAIEPRHFAGWLDWAKANQHGLDFNPTCFSHPLAADGFTLSHRDPAIRQFWIEHCIASRKIGEYFGRELGTPAVTNLWIPDGYKDTPADRLTLDRAVRYQVMDGFGIFLGSGVWPRDRQDLALPFINDLNITVARFGIIDTDFEPRNDNANPYVTDFDAFNLDALPLDWMRRLRAESAVDKYRLTCCT